MLNVVLRRDEVRQLVLSSPIPKPIYATYDLRDAGPFELISDAMAVLVDPAEPDHPGDRQPGQCMRAC